MLFSLNVLDSHASMPLWLFEAEGREGMRHVILLKCVLEGALANYLSNRGIQLYVFLNNEAQVMK
jgi:hypothetical protein